MNNKFWQGSSFKNFVSTIKSQSPKKPPTQPVGAPTLTSMPDRIMRNTDSVLQTMALQIRGKTEALNQILAKYPNNEKGQMPLLSLDVRLGSNLYFDTERGEFNDKPTGMPLYLNSSGAITPDADTSDGTPNNPAKFNEAFATEMLADYQYLINNHSTAIYRETQGKKLYEPFSLADLRHSRTFKGMREFGSDQSEAVYVDKNMGTSREQDLEVVSSRDPGWLLNYVLPAVAFDASRPTRDVVSGIIKRETVAQAKDMPLGGFGKFRSAALPVVLQTAASALNLFSNIYDKGSLKPSYINEIFGVVSDVEPRKVLTDTYSKYIEQVDKIVSGNVDVLDDEVLKSQYAIEQKIIELDRQAHTDFDISTPDGYRSAIEAKVESYEYESFLGARDINSTWTGIHDPEVTKKLLYMRAQVELANGVRMTPNEVEQLKGYIADPTVEFLGNVFLDVGNLGNVGMGALFDTSTLGKLSKLTGVANVQDMQMDGFIRRSILQQVGRGVELGVEGARKIDDVDKFFLKLYDENLRLGTRAPLFRMSKRYLARQIYNSTTDLFNNVTGSSTAIMKTAPLDTFKEINKMAKEIATLRADGVLNIDEIVTNIKQSGKYSPLISSNDRILDVIRMTHVRDPLAKNGNEWIEAFSDAVENARAIKAESLKQAYLGSIDWGDPMKGTPFDEVNDILTKADDMLKNGNLDLDQYNKFLNTELDSAAMTRAMNELTSDELAKTVALKFSGEFLDSHIQARVSEKLTFMDDQLRGKIDKYLGSHKNAAARVARSGLRLFHQAGGWLQSAWVNNILGRAPKFWGVQQPFEQAVTYAFSFGDSLTTSASDYFSNTPDVLRFLDQTPTAGRVGFASMLEVTNSYDSQKYAEGLRRFFTDNPGAWLPNPGAYALYFSESLRNSHSKWLEDLWEKTGVDDLGARQKALVSASHDGRLFGHVPTEDGKKIPTVLGKPGTFKQTAQAWWKATGEAGGGLASANELITRAAIAQKQFILTKEFVSPMVLKEISEQAHKELIAAGWAENQIDDALDNIRRMWDAADGNSTKFVNDLKLKTTGKTPQAYATIPDDLKTLPMGMDMQEQANFLMKTRSELNDYLTILKASDIEVNQETIRPFITETFKVWSREADEMGNPGGLIANQIFGDLKVKRPVSAPTQHFLDDLDFAGGNLDATGYITKKGAYTTRLRQILSDNGIDPTGKTPEQAIAEMQEAVRPIGWKSPEVRRAEAMQAYNESIPDRSRQALFEDIVEKEPADAPLDVAQKFREKYPDEKLSTKFGAPEVDDRFRRDELIAERDAAYAAKNTDKGDYLQAKIDLNKGRGQLYGLKDNLAEVEKRTGTDAGRDVVVAELREETDEVIRNSGRINSSMSDSDMGFLSKKYPFTQKVRKDIPKEVAAVFDELSSSDFKLGELQRKHYKKTTQILTLASREQAALLDTYIADVLSGSSKSIPSYADWIKTFKFDIEWGEDGFTPIAVKSIDPATGIESTWDDTSDVFRGIVQSEDYFGIRNRAVWDAPLSTNAEELKRLRLLSQPPNPKILVDGAPVPEEFHQKLREEFMRTYLAKPAFQEQSLWFYVEPFMGGKKLDDVTTDDIVKALKKASKANDGYAANAMNDLADHVKHLDDYFFHNQLLGDKTFDIPFTTSTVPDDVREFTKTKIASASQLQGIKNALDILEKSVLKQSDDGLLYLKLIDSPKLDALNSVARKFADKSVEMQDVLWRGGKLADIPIEGAIPFMQRRMRVGSETVWDQVAKSIFPFWNYSTRGSAVWLRFALEKPQILRFYKKYVQLGQGQAKREGLTDRYGQPFPSTAGRILIAGTGMWINPSTISSPLFSYIFQPNAVDKYDDDNPDMTKVQKGVSGIVRTLRSRGFRMSPLAEAAMMSLTKLDDRYTTQTVKEKIAYYGLSAAVPADLLPPWIWNSIDAGIQRVEGITDKNPTTSNDTFRPQVEWFDSLVEMSLTEEYLLKIQSAESEYGKNSLGAELKRIITERESNDKYNEHVAKIRNESYFKQLSGYFTALYPNWYSAGRVELNNIRDQRNANYAAINNELTAHIFFPGKSPTEIYNQFNDMRWNTGIGEIFDVRNKVNWVVDDDGNPVTGQMRRDEIAGSFSSDIEREELYAGISAINAERDDRLRELALGRDYSDPAFINIRKETTQKILELQALYPNVQSNWNMWKVGYKPQEMIEEIARNNVLYLISSLRPHYDRENETYPEYSAKLAAWEVTIPLLAQGIEPLMIAQMLKNPIVAYEGQDVMGALNRAITSANLDVYNKWIKDNESAPEALQNGWEELHANFFYEQVMGLTGAIKTEAENLFRQAHPKPTDDQLVEWVMKNYPNRWTEEELRTAMTTPEGEPRDILEADEAMARGKTTDETLRDDIYNDYGWIPQNMKTAFYDELNVRGLSADFDTFMNTGITNPFKKTERDKLQNLRNVVKQILMDLEIQRPMGTELDMQVEAQKLNDQLKQMFVMRFGESYREIVQEYGQLDSQANRKEWKVRNPEWAAMISEYYDLRDEYAKQYPIWALYYTTGKKKTKFYGYGGRSSGRGGGASVARTNEGFQAVGVRPSSQAGTGGDLLAPEYDLNQLLKPKV